MKTYNQTATGAYVCEHRKILRHLGSWRKITDEEKQFFDLCYKCEAYKKHATSVGSPCPCETCEHRKTELQVDNKMRQLRKKYLEGGL